MSRFSERYVQQLLASSEYEALVELQGIFLRWHGFNRQLPDYGLPEPAFVFVEVLTWFAQGIRSGVWTYFEATPPERQQFTLKALKAFGPEGFADNYKFGIEHWRSTTEMAALDLWLSDNDSVCNAWLHSVVQQHNHQLAPLYA